MKERVDHFLFFSDNITNENVIFDDSETRHITNVLRSSIGDKVKVADGRGTFYTVELNVISKRSSIGKIVERVHFSKKQNINLYIGIPEKDSFERLLPMVVPQGVNTIIPVVCEYCQKAWWDNKWEKSIERFNRVVVTSIKQSWNPFLLNIEEPIAFADISNNIPQNLFYADENGELSCNLRNDNDSFNEVVNLIVGPPGGFSPKEIDFLKKSAKGIKLSELRLRSELAGSLLISALYSCGIINPLEKKMPL